MIYPIRRDIAGELLQSGTKFRIHNIPKGNGNKPNPNAQKIIELLKSDYPEIEKTSKTEREFLGKLIKKFKSETEKDISHENFASYVIKKINQNSEIEKETNKLSDIIYA